MFHFARILWRKFMLFSHSRHTLVPALLLLLLALSAAAQAKNSAELSLYAMGNPEILQHDLSAINLAQWQASESKQLFLSPIEGASWVRIDLKNPNDVGQLFFLQLSDNELPSIQGYNFDNESQLQALFANLGLDHRFAERPIQYRRSIYPVFLEPGEQQTLIFHLEHYFPVKVQPVVWSELGFQRYSISETLFFGMLYGALSMIIIYSLFIYYSLRERSYLLFLLFGIFTGLFISMQEGHFYQFVQADTIWPKESFYGLITALMCISFTFLTTVFLHLQQRSRFALRLMLIVGCSLSLFLLLLGLNQQAIILSYFSLAIIATVYTTAIAIAFLLWYVRKSSSAGFFAIAISLCNIGLLIDFSTQLPIMPWPLFNYGYASLGNAAMILVFAFALAYKMRVLQRDQTQASEQLLRINEEKAHSHIEQYREQLQKARLEKEASEATIKNRAKNEFIATMSSDIRTPMNSVLGLTELLSDSPLDEKQQYLVESINSSAKSLLNVINGLVDYSQMQVGQLSIDIRPFNVAKLIDDCVSIFSLQASEEKLYFTGMVDPGTSLQYRGDVDKIRQILLNMLSNAFRFEHLNGISLRVSTDMKKAVNSDELRFEVICHNVLLNQDTRNALLTPFDGKHDKANAELGMLTVSLELVELMQGRLGIDIDEDEQCTILWFSLRLLIPSKDEVIELPDYSKWLTDRHLLVCDPQLRYNNTVKALTTSWGMKTKTTLTSEDAITALLDDEQTYQVLMITEECLTPDVQIAIRKGNVDRNFNTSIILTTRTRYALSKEEMKKQGIQLILEKPWTTQQLYKALMQSMGIDSKTDDGVETKPLKVLIAEDNNINLMVLEGLLKKLHVDISSARDGQQAFELYAKEEPPFDIIFMDCEMPVKDGYQTTLAIRQAEEKTNSKSVIIGLSAHTDTEYREKAIQSGMDDFVAKPISLDYINNLIASYHAGHFDKQDKELLDENEIES